MRIFYFMILLFALFYLSANCQEEVIVNTICDEHSISEYDATSSKINSLEELPQTVQTKLKYYFSKFMGSMADSISYAEGEIFDLKTYYDTAPSALENSENGDIPKYYLHYVFKDNTMGIENYCLHVELGEYGQLLSINWPKFGYKEKTELIPHDEIKKFALKYADSLGLNGNICEIKFDYSYNNLYWNFLYLVESIEDNVLYKGFAIPLNSLNEDNILLIESSFPSDDFNLPIPIFDK